MYVFGTNWAQKPIQLSLARVLIRHFSAEVLHLAEICWFEQRVEETRSLWYDFTPWLFEAQILSFLPLISAAAFWFDVRINLGCQGQAFESYLPFLCLELTIHETISHLGIPDRRIGIFRLLEYPQASSLPYFSKLSMLGTQMTHRLRKIVFQP